VIPLALKPFWIESQLGIADGDRKRPAIAAETLPDGAIRFRAAGEEVALFAPEPGVALSAPQRRLFARFLSYRLPLHPEIVAAIAATGLLPRRLVLVTVAGEDRQPAALVLQRADLVDGDYPLSSTLAPLVASDAGEDPEAVAMRILMPMMYDAASGRLPVGPRPLAAYRRAIDDALQHQQGFEAALLIAEMTLQFGRGAGDCAAMPSDAPCRAPAEINRALAGDERAAELFRAQSLDRENPAQAVAQWRKLRREDVADGFVVDVFLASRLSLAGQRGEAAAAFAAALRGNPYLPGVYKDIGDHFLRGLRADYAWLSYDLGRVLPGRSGIDALSEIDRIERHLSLLHPELF
jgi:hypothetical protein